MFKWFLNGNNKIPLRHQILLVSQLDRNVIEIYDVKYLCVNSGKSVEKKQDRKA